MDADGDRYRGGLPQAIFGWFGRCLAVLLLASGVVGAAEVIPPAPTQFFNDYAGAVSPDTASRLNKQLEDFERETSSQILVAIYPKMQSDSSIEDYTVRVAQAWKVGQKERNNGAVLFVFIQDRKMFLQVGYGLEGALPDALAKQIIENELRPRFRNGDFNGGLSAGVAAILAATKGEYQGTGRTVADRHPPGAEPDRTGLVILIVIVIMVAFVLVRLFQLGASSRGTVYRRRGYSRWGGWTTGGGGWSSGGWGGGGSSGGGSSGGGFSGGGGSFGGGGAGGSW